MASTPLAVEANSGHCVRDVKNESDLDHIYLLT